MKNRIVLVPFPFDDLSQAKVRPAVCLTSEIQPYGHVAFITSQIPSKRSNTDFVINHTDGDFALNGLKVSSTIRLHRLMTVSKALIRRELGELSPRQRSEIDIRLRALFEI